MEPSREDLYESAVRAVLDLCDEADDAQEPIYPAEIRKAIKNALLVDDPEEREEL
jgi:hypothetical protein